jgi:hypothetical protein
VHARGQLPNTVPTSPRLQRHQRRTATPVVHMALCVYCRAIVPGFPGPAFVGRMTSRLSLTDHQPTLPTLQKSSLLCPLCGLLLRALIRAQGHDSELFTLVESEPHSVKVMISDTVTVAHVDVGEERSLRVFTKYDKEWYGRGVLLLSRECMLALNGRSAQHC